MATEYYKERDRRNTYILNENLPKLPPLCTDYFNSIALARTASTMALYSSQLATFFTWLYNKDDEHIDPSCYTIEHLKNIESNQISFFLQELRANGDNDETIRGYLRAISAFYKYLNRTGKLDTNPVDAIMRPKHKKSPKVYLDNDDYKKFSNSVETGFGLSKHESAYREATGSTERDILIMAILSKTGIRISELVGLDLENIDQEHCSFTVIRKGGNETRVYYSDDISIYLKDYLSRRTQILAPGESALLLSHVGKTKGHRISVRAVEKLVKKYAMAAGVTNAEKMTPHKLRHTCAMALLKATGDIALVKKQLGHESIVSTTIYAEADESDLQRIRNLL